MCEQKAGMAHTENSLQKVRINGVKPKKDSLYGDISNLSVEKAIETARDRGNWKKLRSSRRC